MTLKLITRFWSRDFLRDLNHKFSHIYICVAPVLWFLWLQGKRGLDMGPQEVYIVVWEAELMEL